MACERMNSTMRWFWRVFTLLLVLVCLRTLVPHLNWGFLDKLALYNGL